MSKNTKQKRKISEVPEADKKPWSQSQGKRKKSMVRIIFKKIGFNPKMKREGDMYDERGEAV